MINRLELLFYLGDALPRKRAFSVTDVRLLGTRNRPVIACIGNQNGRGQTTRLAGSLTTRPGRMTMTRRRSRPRPGASPAIGSSRRPPGTLRGIREQALRP
jgi:hypothetical protein